ncbi:helix-turn-helix domain-containing protein [Lihuaxuella thermophila]|uniref:Helix-turn-helix domain-containing protein n=1 Tax=Lihuaxuella thermophila TaxID=1173111 RepID=A0A1H8GKT8_9BACL|nr:RodZ domain-containing protein [Lihuaxuella thermophila]SEN43928.1 Helix-turn-helix domain-containing protein [Lihuaxuella thermophila]
MFVEIGSYLRQARESIGLSLDQLQEKTKIQKSFLVAIENGEFHKLPSPFYVRTYLRSYANCVKVEPHHILRQYRKAEQAERGLTGVHKAIDEKDLEQTKRLPLQKTGRNPVVTGPQKTVSQTQTFPNAPRNRTSLNTALTIAKSSNEPADDLSRKDKELARRNLGYQRAGNLMRTNPPRPSLAEDAPPSGPVRPHPEPTVHPQHETVREPGTGGLSRRSRESQKVSPPIPSVNQDSLSRMSRVRKDLSGSIPPVVPSRASFESADEDKGFVPEGVSRVQTLSRKAVKGRKAANKSGKTKSAKLRYVWMTVAGVAVLVPLVWGAMNFLGDDEKNAGNPPKASTPADESPKTSQGQPEQPAGGQPTGTLKLVEQAQKINHYHLSGADQIKIAIKGTGGGSWVQIRDNMNLQDQKDYIEDRTVTKGYTWTYTYQFDNSPEVYILLGKPQNVIVSVNGQAVNTANWIHIKKTD